MVVLTDRDAVITLAASGTPARPSRQACSQPTPPMTARG
jgi:hypothetical protein